MDFALDWLEGLPRFSVLKYNLYRTWVLLKQVVPTFTEFNVYFISGSKGKGTVAAATAAILRAAGIPTGLLTSPHLISIGERLNFHGKNICPGELEDYLQVIRRLPKLPESFGTWTYSEVLLAVALLWFWERGASTVVIEAGLGGRLDPGNIFRHPRGTCITSVALEHQGILGNTVAEIAGEKAGIIKPCTPLVSAAQGVALDVISRRAALLKAPLLLNQVDFGWEQTGTQVLLRLPGRSLRFEADFLTAAAQVNKAMAACMAALDPGVDDAAIIQGVLAPGLPGRFEIIPGSPPMVLDVAHTPEAVANLVEGTKARFPGKKVAYVAGFLADKSGEAMLKQLLAVSSRVFLAPVQDRRSFQGSGISIPQVEQSPSIAAAMEKGRAGVDVLCVTGSFAAVREALLYCQRNASLLE